MLITYQMLVIDAGRNCVFSDKYSFPLFQLSCYILITLIFTKFRLRLDALYVPGSLYIFLVKCPFESRFLQIFGL